VCVAGNAENLRCETVQQEMSKSRVACISVCGDTVKGGRSSALLSLPQTFEKAAVPHRS
jgi:hypothetical protein